MIIDFPQCPNGICFVTDTNTKYDREVMDEKGGQLVLHTWPFGKAVYGAEWQRVTRVSLYKHGENADALTPEQKLDVAATAEPKRLKRTRMWQARNRHAVQQSLRDFLVAKKFRLIFVLQSLSAEDVITDDDGKVKGLKGTTCWRALEPPDTLPEMAGTLWRSAYGDVIPLLHPRFNGNFVWNAEIRHWMLGGLQIAKGKYRANEPLITQDVPHQRVEALARLLAQARAGVPIAFDLETVTQWDLITCVGLSDGSLAVSIPWDSFQPHGQTYFEPGHTPAEEQLVRAILATKCDKYAHNGVDFDVPFLANKGVPVCGKVLDSYLMHGVVHKQLRHGLQRACAQYHINPPWKSMHRAAGKNEEGLTVEDAEYWIQDPKELRLYNAQDAYYTWHLAHALRNKVGI